MITEKQALGQEAKVGISHFCSRELLLAKASKQIKWLITGRDVNYITCYFLLIKCYIFKGGISNGIRLLLMQIPYSCIDQLAFYLTTLQ